MSGLDPQAQASVISVEQRQYGDEAVKRHGDLGHVIVQIGFPGKEAYHFIPLYHYPDGWQMEMPPESDPRRRRTLPGEPAD